MHHMFLQLLPPTLLIVVIIFLNFVYISLNKNVQPIWYKFLCSACFSTVSIHLHALYTGHEVNFLLAVSPYYKDIPAKCSNASITCEIRLNNVDESMTEIMIHLSTSDMPMCVKAYQFVFNGEVDNASANTPLAVFNISNISGQPFLKLDVYTLDYEGRRPQMPCTFNIIGEFTWKWNQGISIHLKISHILHTDTA